MLPAWVTKAGVVATIKFVAVAGLVALLIHAAKGVYDDQVAVRERIITESTTRVQAESRVTVLQGANRNLQQRAVEQQRELAAARKAVTALNATFSDIKREQAAMKAGLADIERDLDTKPVPQVEAEANALMQQVNEQWEADFR